MICFLLLLGETRDRLLDILSEGRRKSDSDALLGADQQKHIQEVRKRLLKCAEVMSSQDPVEVIDNDHNDDDGQKTFKQNGKPGMGTSDDRNSDVRTLRLTNLQLNISNNSSRDKLLQP